MGIVIFVQFYWQFWTFEVAEKITSAKKCRRDTMILLFTSAITSAFAECRRELERLNFIGTSYIWFRLGRNNLFAKLILLDYSHLKIFWNEKVLLNLFYFASYLVSKLPDDKISLPEPFPSRSRTKRKNWLKFLFSHFLVVPLKALWRP